MTQNFRNNKKIEKTKTEILLAKKRKQKMEGRKTPPALAVTSILRPGWCARSASSAAGAVCAAEAARLGGSFLSSLRISR